MEVDQEITEADSAGAVNSGVNIESFMSPEDQHKLEFLRALARAKIQREEEVCGPVRAKIKDLFSRTIGDLFRDTHELGQKELERRQIQLREVISTGEYSYPDDRLFPRLELVSDASLHIHGILAETDVEVPPEIFSHMHGILMDTLSKQKPWWFKDARARLADLAGKIDQYKIVAESGNGNSKSMATDLSESFEKTAKTYLQWSYYDLEN